MTQERDQNPTIPRRELLQKAGKTALIFAAGGIAGAGTLLALSKKEENEPIEEEKIYTSGEMIQTPAGPVLIENWRLLFDQDMLRQYSNEKGVQVEFQLSHGKNHGLHKSISVDMGGEGASLSEDVDKNGIKYWSIMAMPPDDDKELVFLTYKENILNGQNTQTARIKHYAISPSYFTYVKDDERKTFYSEVDLDFEVKKKIHEHLTAFANFGLDLPFYIYESEEREGEYRRFDQNLNATSEVFKNPDFPEEGFLFLHHEASHAIHNKFIVNLPDQTPDNILFDAYKGLVEGAATMDSSGLVRVPMPFYYPLALAENNPYFAIFDESHYVQNTSELGAQFGHPHDNYTELFASAMTVMRFFPEKFIENYFASDQNIKVKVRQVVRAIFNMLSWNQQAPIEYEVALKKLFPQYDKIASAFGLR